MSMHVQQRRQSPSIMQFARYLLLDFIPVWAWPILALAWSTVLIVAAIQVMH